MHIGVKLVIFLFAGVVLTRAQTKVDVNIVPEVNYGSVCGLIFYNHEVFSEDGQCNSSYVQSVCTGKCSSHAVPNIFTGTR